MAVRTDRIFKQDDKIVYHKRTDPTPVLESVKLLRNEQPAAPLADSVQVARLDAHVVEMWAQEAGIRWDDRAAMRDLIRRKLLDSDNAAFRVWQGTY